MQEAKIYGTSWSVASWDVRRLLDGIGAPYAFVDLEADAEARAWVNDLGNGQVSPPLPVVKLPGDVLLIGATRREIATFYGVRLDTSLLQQFHVVSDQGLSSAE